VGHSNTAVRELVGGDVLEEVVTEDLRTGERSRLRARALFVFIGAEPQTGWLDNRLALDEHGFILTGAEAAGARRDGSADGQTSGSWHSAGREPSLLETSRPGVFAAGDVRSGSIKRLTAAAGEGAMAVRLVHEHLAA